MSSSIMALWSLTEIKILSKHEVSFESAKTVFDDPLYVDFYDPEHLEGVDIMLVKGIKKGKIIELLE
ncbi:BrnT family toxin [Microcystis sp. M145S2]|uniref:BrnT family toxin n=2 Tax=Microcystis TaxID=1125 RepID=UPI0025842481|nr:BrnT family toxin [Microcystis sp. M145S2]